MPVRFINEALSPGLKRGGVLNIVRHEVEVTCPADAIPEYFEFNLEGLEIGRSIHISAIKMPEGVKPTIPNRDFTVATIAGHKIEEEPTPGAAAAPPKARRRPRCRRRAPLPKAPMPRRRPAERRRQGAGGRRQAGRRRPSRPQAQSPPTRARNRRCAGWSVAASGSMDARP